MIKRNIQKVCAPERIMLLINKILYESIWLLQKLHFPEKGAYSYCVFSIPINFIYSFASCPIK